MSTPLPQDVFALWDSAAAYPHIDQIPLPDRITHVVVARGMVDGYRYLHEASLAFHEGVLHVGWANAPDKETNTNDELYRTRRTVDGGVTWSDADVIAPGGPACAHNHGVMAVNGETLWALVARHDDKQFTGFEAFTWDRGRGRWSSRGIVARQFIPFDRPRRMADGNWIMAGETAFVGGNPAVAISEGDDFLRWNIVPIPLVAGMRLIFPEATVMPCPDGRLMAVMRYEDHDSRGRGYLQSHPHNLRALASESRDGGRTWTAAQPSNLPMHPSKPFAGRLSTGEGFLIHNVPHPEEVEYGRHTLAIALTPAGSSRFNRLIRLRHGKSPTNARTQSAQWSYPFAVEHEGQLYIGYTINKSDCGLSIVPVGALR